MFLWMISLYHVWWEGRKVVEVAWRWNAFRSQLKMNWIHSGICGSPTSQSVILTVSRSFGAFGCMIKSRSFVWTFFQWTSTNELQPTKTKLNSGRGSFDPQISWPSTNLSGRVTSFRSHFLDVSSVSCKECWRDDADLYAPSSVGSCTGGVSMGASKKSTDTLTVTSSSQVVWKLKKK